MNSKDFHKGKRKAEALISKAKAERDSKGYRENLGYDKYNELQDYLSKLELVYNESWQILDWYNRQCDAL